MEGPCASSSSFRSGKSLVRRPDRRDARISRNSLIFIAVELGDLFYFVTFGIENHARCRRHRRCRLRDRCTFARVHAYARTSRSVKKSVISAAHARILRRDANLGKRPSALRGLRDGDNLSLSPVRRPFARSVHDDESGGRGGEDALRDNAPPSPPPPRATRR